MIYNFSVIYCINFMIPLISIISFFVRRYNNLLLICAANFDVKSKASCINNFRVMITEYQVLLHIALLEFVVHSFYRKSSPFPTANMFIIYSLLVISQLKSYSYLFKLYNTLTAVFNPQHLHGRFLSDRQNDNIRPCTNSHYILSASLIYIQNNCVNVY